MVKEDSNQRLYSQKISTKTRIFMTRLLPIPAFIISIQALMIWTLVFLDDLQGSILFRLQCVIAVDFGPRFSKLTWKECTSSAKVRQKPLWRVRETVFYATTVSDPLAALLFGRSSGMVIVRTVSSCPGLCSNTWRFSQAKNLAALRSSALAERLVERGPAPPSSASLITDWRWSGRIWLPPLIRALYMKWSTLARISCGLWRTGTISNCGGSCFLRTDLPRT